LRGEVDARSASGEGGSQYARTQRVQNAARPSAAGEFNESRTSSLAPTPFANPGGHKFVRQESIGPYIVDFVCREQRLIIEVDGGQHATAKRDAIRDRWLAEHRYRVLRFWNNDVFGNMEGVLETIAAALPADSPPHPDR
jgi:very-short-patch-repair endonuclease